MHIPMPTSCMATTGTSGAKAGAAAAARRTLLAYVSHHATALGLAGYSRAVLKQAACSDIMGAIEQAVGQRGAAIQRSNVHVIKQR